MEKVAKKLCLGLAGNQAAWETGASDLAVMEPPSPDDCWSSKAYEVLRQVAAFQTLNPGGQFQLAAASGTACEPTLVTLQDDAGDRPPIFVCAGDPIVLVGRLGGLPPGTIRRVNVGPTTAAVGHRESFENNNYPFGDFYFAAPPLVTGQSTTVDVTIADGDWEVTGSASFEYAADQSTCPGAVPPAAPVPPDKAVPQDPVPPPPPPDKAVPQDPVPPGTIP